MSIRFYHRTGRRSGVSYGPLTAVLLFPFYLAWLMLLALFWLAYGLIWALSWLISVGALAFAGLHRGSPWAEELAAFVAAPSIHSWWRGRAARATRRARQQAARSKTSEPAVPLR